MLLQRARFTVVASHWSFRIRHLVTDGDVTQLWHLKLAYRTGQDECRDVDQGSITLDVLMITVGSVPPTGKSH
jgi:hypothetical protein